MRRAHAKQTLKIRLLAFVLALALVWYSLNPAPRTLIQIRPEDELPDEKKRDFKSQIVASFFLPIVVGTLDEVLDDLTPLDEDVDDFDWPEFIDG